MLNGTRDACLMFKGNVYEKNTIHKSKFKIKVTYKVSPGGDSVDYVIF